MNMLARVEDENAPCRAVVVFDAPGPTFRHEFYGDYKAHPSQIPPAEPGA
jgi:DNA polymerase-1